MPINITFGGANIKRPGAYSTVDSAGMFPISLGGFKTLAVIGLPNATNTTPVGTVVYFNSPVTAKIALGDCEALDLMNIAWAHGADLIGFSPVAVTALDADWQSAIDLLTTEAVDGLIPAINTPAINAKVMAHCELMSSVKNRRERRGFVGHANGLAVPAIVALQLALTSEYMTMATPGVYVLDSTGARVLQGSEYLASAYAGTWAGQPSQEPITYKYVNFSGLEQIFTGDEIETLLTGHIAPTEYVRNKGYRIVQGLTLSSDADLTKQELSVSSVKIQMSQALRDYFEEKYIGQAGSSGIEVTMYNDLVTMLEGFITAGLISGYVQDTVSVVKDGTSFIMGWEGKPTLPINNFLITSHLSL